MEVLNFEYDLENGFAFIEVNGKTDSDRMTVQCCLFEPKSDAEKDTRPGFQMKIDQDDCGHNWGICGDANEKAFNYWGENRCMTLLFKYAEKNGIELI